MSPWDILAWVTSAGLAVIVVMIVALLVVFSVSRFGKTFNRKQRDDVSRDV